MPKGKKNHKGLHRRFTAPEEIERQLKEGKKKEDESGSDESESEEEEEEEEKDASGNVRATERAGIEVCNPNYQKEKNKKLSEVGDEVPSDPTQLTRRQREEIEAERAKREYERLHMAGKTAEAQADLARLALVRREREEAARKREAEKEAKEAARSNKNMDLSKLQEKAIRGPSRGRNARKKAEKKEAEKNKAKGDDSAAKASS